MQPSEVAPPGPERETWQAMRAIQLIGLLLWRGGQLLAAGAALFYGCRFILRFWKLPVEVEAALGLFGAGLLLVVLSLILERVVDLRLEKESAE